VNGPEYERALARIQTNVSALDRSVRAGAIEIVAGRVVTLTDAQVDDDAVLVVALARVARLAIAARGGLLGARCRRPGSRLCRMRARSSGCSVRPPTASISRSWR
jgi:hypothetical protein